MNIHRRPRNTMPVPAYGIGLDNGLTHQIGTVSNSGIVHSARYGHIPPYNRTAHKRYAKTLNGRRGTAAISGEVPFRQEFKAGNPQIIVTSPGKNPNRPQIMAQEVLYIQALRKRGLI